MKVVAFFMCLKSYRRHSKLFFSLLCHFEKKLKNFHLNALKVDNQSGNFLNAASNSKISKFSENPSFPPTYWNQCFDKSRLKNFILWFVLHYGEQKTLELVEELKTLGFKYATKAGISLGIDDLKIPPKKAEQSIPPSLNKCATKLLVVVLPCVPAIAIQYMLLEIIPNT